MISRDPPTQPGCRRRVRIRREGVSVCLLGVSLAHLADDPLTVASRPVGRVLSGLVSVTWQHSPEMMPDLRFHLSWLLVSSCVFSGSGGTETELADLGPPVG